MSAPEPARGAAPAAVFAALGDPTRLRLVTTLSDGTGRSLASLSGDGAITRQAVAKHLAVLEAAGLVHRSRAGRETRFALRPEPVAQARDWLAEVEAQWDAALDRLRAYVED